MAATRSTPTDRRQGETNVPSRREPFAPYWLLIAILGATLFALWLLFPRTYLEQTLRAQVRPDAADLAYLQLLVRANPDNPGIRLLLARQALRARDLSLARSALAPWQPRAIDALPLDVARLRLQLLRVELSSTPANAPQWKANVARYTHALQQFAPRMTSGQLLREAHFAQRLGDYQATVALDRMILRRASNNALQRMAYAQGIAGLLAAGTPRAALDFARKEISHVPHDDALWRRLIRLALAADRPDLAARYARRLVGMRGGSA